MEITFNQEDALNAAVKINISEADYAPVVTKKLKEYARKANLKGFRPGKVPLGVVNKMFGKSVRAEEINTLVFERIESYLSENEINILHGPVPADEHQMQDLESSSDFEFDFRLGLMPKVNIPEFAAGLSTELIRSEMDEAEFADHIKQLLEGHADREEAEEAGENDDLSGILTGEDDFNKEVFLRLDEVRESERAMFVGLKKDDSTEFALADLFENEEQIRRFAVLDKETEIPAGKMTFTLVSVHRITPIGEQDLAVKLFGDEEGANLTVEEFREKLRKEVNEQVNKESAIHNVNEIFKSALHSNLEMPVEFIKKYQTLTHDGQEPGEDELKSLVEAARWETISTFAVKDEKFETITDEMLRKQMYDSLMMQFGGQGAQMAPFLDQFIDEEIKKKDSKMRNDALSHLSVRQVSGVLRNYMTTKETVLNMADFKAKMTEIYSAPQEEAPALEEESPAEAEA